MNTLNKKAPVSVTTRAPSRDGLVRDGREKHLQLEWFYQQGARFVRVAAWNAKVNAPGKQPVENAWQKKLLALKDVLPHLKNGGNVGLLCGKPSNGLCLLDVDDRLQDFLEYFPGLMDAPIIQRADAPNRGKIVLKITGELPRNKKWHDVHLEFLSTGNQGVIPPSLHPGGARYELIRADNPALEFDGERLMRICEMWEAAHKPAEVTASTNTTADRGRPSRDTMAFLELGAGPHTRNNRLFKAACDLNGCGYSQAEAEMMLLPVWARIGKPEKEARATIESAYKQPRNPANPHAFGRNNGYKVKPAVVIESDEVIEETAQVAPILSAMPDLPKIAQLSEAEIKQGRKAGKFIDDYMVFAMKDAPMSPPLFHQTYALAILSSAIARRVYVSVGTNAIYPNLYIMLSAPSTLYTKTTGYKSAMKLFETAGLSHLLLPDGVTPQSLITELSNRPQDNFRDWAKDDQDEWQRERLFAGQRAWWIDEAARLLSQFQLKHLAELLPIVLRLYECESKIKVSTQIRGRETVRNAYLTICGPTTPAALRPFLKMPEYWTNGLFARFLLVAPDTAPVRVFYPDPFPVPPALAKQINQLAFDRLQQPQENALGPTPPPPSVEAKIELEVKQRWDNYHAAMFEIISKRNVPEKLHACYGRLHEKAIKIAMLLAASDWAKMAKGNPLVIRSVHWYRAQELTEGYRASLHRIIEEAGMPDNTEDDELVERILARVQTSTRNSRREIAIDLHMQTGMKRSQLDMTLDQLVRDGALIEKEIKGTRGPSTVRLYPAQN
ncbi:MAG: DUF3987 domain-containing protein [Anaerolineales bacterium]|nr:DUF3987 domain-containing protein [Anaerolineales bacterium]